MSFLQHLYRHDWDSHLTVRNNMQSTLTVDLKVLLLPRDPAGGPGSTHLARNESEIRHGSLRDGGENGQPGRLVRCRSWRPTEWHVYKARFENVVEDVWSYKLILIVPEPPALTEPEYRVFQFSPDAPAAIDCTLAIQLQLPEHSAGAHTRLAVVHQEDDEHHQFRSFVRQMPGQQDGGVLSNRDVDLVRGVTNSEPRTAVQQYPAAHEVSHLLLLQHIACPGGESRCYGETTAQEMTIRGRGNLVTTASAEPWLRSAREHTFTTSESGWRVIGYNAWPTFVANWLEAHRRPRP